MHAFTTTLADLPPLEGCGELLTGCLGKVGALDGLKTLPTDFTAPISHSGHKRVNNKLINPFKTRSHGNLNCSLVPRLTKIWCLGTRLQHRVVIMAVANQPDTRAELAELLKRRNELTVSAIFYHFEFIRSLLHKICCGARYLEFSLFLLTGKSSQPWEANLCVWRQLFGGHSGVW